MKIGDFRLGGLLVVLCLVLTSGAVPGSAAAEGPAISVSPDHFAFGPINVGGELGEPGEFTVTNSGTGSVHLDTAAIVGPDRESFVLLPNASSCFWLEVPGELTAGSSCTLITHFDPLKEGPNQASLELTSDAASSPDLMPLTGTGFPRLMPGAAFDPQTIDFGARPIGSASTVRSLTLESNGTGDLEIGPVTISGDDPGQFDVVSNPCSGRVMATGDSCEIKVQFTPSRVGASGAEVRVITDADGADTTAELSGTGVDPSAVGKRRSRVTVPGDWPDLGASRIQTVPIRCVTTGMKFCRGRITIKAPGRMLGLRQDRPVRIGSQAYTLTAGTSRVRVRLSRQVTGVLTSRKSLRVQVSATSRQGDGSTRTTRVTRRLRR